MARKKYAIPVIIRYEPEILGTGGAIKNVADFWDDNPFMVINSDIITDIQGDALAIPIQSVAVRTPGQLKRSETGGNGNVAIADDSASLGYKPDKDGFVEVVFVVEENSVVAKQVTTGIQSETHIEIKEGLNDGDEIVVGNYRAISQDLKNGSRITIQNAMAKN